MKTGEKFTQKCKQSPVKGFEPDNFVWLPSEERIKDCINNTIESLYNSGCLQLKDGKYAIRKNAFLD